MANLQQITLTVDELTPAGTLLHPTDGYEAIESVTFSGLWDYWANNIDWGDINGMTHGVLYLDPYYFIYEAYPEISSNWNEYESELLLDPATFNPVLRSKNDYHVSTRCGVCTFKSCSGEFYDYNSGNSIYLPEMRWQLIEAASGDTSRQVLSQFNESSLTESDISSGVVLKFLGTAYPGGMYSGSRGSYYAYFVNTEWDPCYFYLLGLESTARNRIDPAGGDYLDYDQPSIVNTTIALDWWYGAYEPTLYVKYLDQEISY